MIDVHSHFIFGVDDGSGSLDHSLEMLAQAAADGVTDTICTPHYRRGVFECPNGLIRENFEKLKAANTYPVNLYLGQEIAKHTGMFSRVKDGALISLNGTKYVLLEFRYTEDSEIEDTVLDACYYGYKPVIAHIERYEYVKEKDVERFIDAGAFIQVNASSFFMKGGQYKKRVERYLKSGLVDFVASDMHHSREYCMKKAYDYVSSKFGVSVADAVLKENAKAIIK